MHSIEVSSPYLYASVMASPDRRWSDHGMTIPIGYLDSNYSNPDSAPMADCRLAVKVASDSCGSYLFNRWSA